MKIAAMPFCPIHHWRHAQAPRTRRWSIGKACLCHAGNWLVACISCTGRIFTASISLGASASFAPADAPLIHAAVADTAGVRGSMAAGIHGSCTSASRPSLALRRLGADCSAALQSAGLHRSLGCPLPARGAMSGAARRSTRVRWQTCSLRASRARSGSQSDRQRAERDCCDGSGDMRPPPCTRRHGSGLRTLVRVTGSTCKACAVRFRCGFAGAGRAAALQRRRFEAHP